MVLHLSALLPWLSTALAGSPAEPPTFHAVAYVTDSLSHGVLGDNLLSLNEAIQLHNGQLTWNQLSFAERGQLSLIPGTGATTDVTWIDIDGTSTPVITVERDLTSIVDTSFGLLIKGFNEPPVIDFSGANITRGFVSPSNSLALEDLILHGGPFGADVVQTDVAGQSGMTLRNVRFENQTGFGLRVTATTPNAIGRLILEDCWFEGVPQAIDWQEAATGRTTIFEARNVTVRGATSGIGIVLGPGGTGRYTLDRLDVEAASRGLTITRPTAADRSILVESTHVRLRGATCAQIDGSPVGVAAVTLRMWDAAAPPAGTALQLGALGDRVHGTVEDSTLVGDVAIRTGAAPLPLTLENLRCVDGVVRLGTTPAQALTVATSRFDDCTVTTEGTATVVIDGACFVGGSVAGSATAPITLTASFATTVGAFVQQQNAVPAPQLGSMDTSPDTVAIGSTLTIHADLPPGLAAAFVLGFTAPTPVLLPQPFHLYSDPVFTYTLPGIWRAQQSLPFVFPPHPWLVGLDLVVQCAVVPDPGMVAPALQLPPGRRFALR